MGPGLGANSLVEVVGRMAEGKNAGGVGPPQAFGQAEATQPATQTPEAADQDQQQLTPWDQYLARGPDVLDPTGIHELQQIQLATAADFSANPRSANNMGPSTSEAVRMRGNRLWENAANWERYKRAIELQAEMQRLGIYTGDQEGPYEREHREEEEKKKNAPQQTPSGYNPNTGQPPNQPQGQQNATPSGFGMARF